MIATWMFYCLLCAAGLSLAATAAERLLLAGRAPVRVVWIGAMLLSLGIPLFASSTARSSPPPVTTLAAPTALAGTPRNVAGARLSTPASSFQPPAAARSWAVVAAARLRAMDSTLLVAWAVLSAALAISFTSGVVGLVWMRRRWTERVVQGVTVHVSRRTGPAVVGTTSPTIVIPEWTLSLAPEQLSLMLRHEAEHLRARDGQLLIAAQMALIAMPWNVALWWQVLRLRVAIEMDCDARVLRVADARSYGELLLEVARPHRSLKLAGMIAFAERATQLERRIRVLKRHRVATSKRATVAASTIALVALSAAWVVPHPVTPLHAAAIASPSASALPLVVMHDVAASAPMRIPPAPAAVVTRRPSNALRKTAEPCANDSTEIGAAYRFLYDGVTLSPDNQSKACALLARLVDEQLAEDAVAEATARDVRALRASAQSQRDVKLMALLKTDADRATFQANASRTFGTVTFNGADVRGRVSGDTIVVADGAMAERKMALQAAAVAREAGATNIVARATNEPGGVVVSRVMLDSQSTDRVARLKEELRAVMSQMNDKMSDANYTRLFNGISLSPDDEQVARKVLVETLQQMNTVQQPMIRPATRLRINPQRGVAFVAAGADSALVELASTQADRDRVRSRIRVVPQ